MLGYPEGFPLLCCRRISFAVVYCGQTFLPLLPIFLGWCGSPDRYDNEEKFRAVTLSYPPFPECAVAMSKTLTGYVHLMMSH